MNSIFLRQLFFLFGSLMSYSIITRTYKMTSLVYGLVLFDNIDFLTLEYLPRTCYYYLIL